MTCLFFHSSILHPFLHNIKTLRAFNPQPYITLSPGPIPIPDDTQPIFKVRVTADPSLNVRSGPSLVYPRIGLLNNGEEVDVLDIGGD